MSVLFWDVKVHCWGVFQWQVKHYLVKSLLVESSNCKEPPLLGKFCSLPRKEMWRLRLFTIHLPPAVNLHSNFTLPAILGLSGRDDRKGPVSHGCYGPLWCPLRSSLMPWSQKDPWRRTDFIFHVLLATMAGVLNLPVSVNLLFISFLPIWMASVSFWSLPILASISNSWIEIERMSIFCLQTSINTTTP